MASLLVACFLFFEDCVSSSSIKRRFLAVNFGIGEVFKIDPSSKLLELRRRMMAMIVVLHLIWILFSFFNSLLVLASPNSNPVSMGIFSYELRVF
jgi:hypothetical protein